MLQQAQVVAPQFTSELLLAHALRVDRVYLRAHPERELTDVEQVHLARYLRDRLAGAPTQYITGHQEFWGLDIHVNPSVLIPRPETEHAVERCLALADRTARQRILDCGTGSGCIAISLAKELRNARIFATDISGPALDTAGNNAHSLGLRDSIDFVRADLLNGIADSNLDIIVSNPPYIAEDEAPTLAPEVRDYEPRIALFSGSDAAAVYRKLVPEAARALRPGGWLVVELGHTVAPAVRDLFAAGPWTMPSTDHDLAGIERVMYAQRT